MGNGLLVCLSLPRVFSLSLSLSLSGTYTDHLSHTGQLLALQLPPRLALANPPTNPPNLWVASSSRGAKPQPATTGAWTEKANRTTQDSPPRASVPSLGPQYIYIAIVI